MTNLKLTAKLKAYSKSPFYSDYVRGVNVDDSGNIIQLEPNILYGLRDGKWDKIFEGDMSHISDRLVELENKCIALDSEDERLLLLMNSMGVSFDEQYNFIRWVGSTGKVVTIPIRVRVDNKTIVYNDYNELTTAYVPDEITISKTPDGCFRADALYTDKNDIYGDPIYITGKLLSDKLTDVDDTLEYLTTRVNDLPNDPSANGSRYVLPTIDLGHLYINYYNKLLTLAELELSIDSALCDVAFDYFDIDITYEPSKLVENKKLIPNGFLIRDVYRGNLWKWLANDGYTDTGKFIEVYSENASVDANNIDVSGVVRGVSWQHDEEYQDSWEELPGYLSGHIDNEITTIDDAGNVITSVDRNALPTISINGLKSRLTDLDKSKVEVIDNISGELDIVYVLKSGTNEWSVDNNIGISDSPEHAGTVVKRTSDGNVTSNAPVYNKDTVNLEYFGQRLQGMSDIINLLTVDDYGVTFIDNEGDITASDDYANTIITL